MPKLSKQAFWDVHFEALDYENQARFIIERVFQFGTLEDLYEVIRYYGMDFCKKTIIEAHFLRANAISTASLIFDIPKSSISCYNTRQSHLHF